jgi:hypothetical protein
MNSENDFHYQVMSENDAMSDGEGRAAALLRDAAGLGAARVVLRSCDGFMELFCDTACFELAGEWLAVRRPEAHLHVQVRSLRGATLLNAGSDAYPHAPSLWLIGRCGKPCVIVILDVTTGVERVRQMVAFSALRERWGEHVGFRRAPRTAVERVLH